ncbi:DUF3376 domain-containing protein [Kitasatospora camelliae]|uniref:DUF3376 domain-containing protein n=1 Tax=Kitasatospora camelliae TaxID=3156397 RepID=A0AAU8K5E4_9ACTN
MAETRPAAPTATPREVRLALVLNGGISLAVWMGGVAHELDLLRRASRGDPESSVERPEDRPVFRLWQRLCRDAGKRVLIDVIAGTSAGGLNGMLLATAIGRGVALPYLRDTWSETAALDRLLAPDASAALMRGEVVEEALGEVVRRMGEVPQTAEPVTLFLTATALDGRPQSYVDGYGGRFDVRDHRRVYRFQQDTGALGYEPAGGTAGPDPHGADPATDGVRGGPGGTGGDWRIRERPRRDFTGDVGHPGSALLRAARATAGFPVAFAPVHEDPMRDHREHPAGIPTSCVMDGGILDNEPFRPVLDAIGGRRVDGPFERVLVYVVPSAGRVPQERIGGKRCEDILWTEAASNALLYPREGNFRSGTEDLAARLRTSVGEVQNRLFRRMREEPGHATRLILHAAELVDDYRELRAAAVVDEARRGMADADTVRTLVPTPETDPARLLDRDTNWLPPRPTPHTDPVHHPDLTTWTWGLAPAERVIRLLLDDLKSHRDGSPERSAAVTTATATLSRQLRATLAVLDAVHRELAESPRTDLGDATVVERIGEVFARLRVPHTLGTLVREAAEAYLEALRHHGTRWTSTEDLVACCLAVEVLTHAFAPAATAVEPPTPRFTFLRLGPDTTGPLFDQDRYTDIGDRKLYGVRLNHFGAFVHEDWRASDFAWGRLDAVHHLLRVLLPSPGERNAAERRLHTAVMAAETGHDRMRRNLDELLQDDSALLHSFAETDQGRDSLRRAVGSALALLLSDPAPDADPTVTQRLLRRVHPYLRAALGPARPTGGWILRLLRRFTRHTRSQLHRDPRPDPLHAAVRRDLRGLRRTAVLVAALCVLGVVATVALVLCLAL